MSNVAADTDTSVVRTRPAIACDVKNHMFLRFLDKCSVSVSVPRLHYALRQLALAGISATDPGLRVPGPVNFHNRIQLGGIQACSPYPLSCRLRRRNQLRAFATPFATCRGPGWHPPESISDASFETAWFLDSAVVSIKRFSLGKRIRRTGWSSTRRLVQNQPPDCGRAVYGEDNHSER